MTRAYRERLLCFATAATRASTMDPTSEKLAWRLAETFGWDLPDQESGGLRQLAIDTLLLSVELRERADELDRVRLRERPPRT